MIKLTVECDRKDGPSINDSRLTGYSKRNK